MSDPPDPPAAETASDLFRALVLLHRDGRVALRYDFKRLQHMDCPVGVEADANIWAYAVLAAVILALWRGGWLAALAVGVAGAALYFTVGQSYVRRRIKRRIDERALLSLDDWQRLWRFGGIALTAGDGEPCAAPQGNWMAFVRELQKPTFRAPVPPGGASRWRG